MNGLSSLIRHPILTKPLLINHSIEEILSSVIHINVVFDVAAVFSLFYFIFCGHLIR